MTIWPVIISIVVLIVGFVIYKICTEILEEKEAFRAALILFVVLYASAAFFLKIFFIKTPPGPANLSSFANLFISSSDASTLTTQNITSDQMPTPSTPDEGDIIQ
jgi:hypothetical protein